MPETAQAQADPLRLPAAAVGTLPTPAPRTGRKPRKNHAWYRLISPIAVVAASLLLLDEPFSALDALTRIAMHALVLRLWQSHHPAVLLVTHDVDEALVLADRVLVLADGRITFSGQVDYPALGGATSPA